jgi:hypothetical protein
MKIKYHYTLIILVSILLHGCVIVPYKVDPEVKIEYDKELSKHYLVTTGPRKLLTQIEDSITKFTQNIQIIDSIHFRDTAFPDGDWRMVRLFDDQNCQNIATELNARYLVLIGKLDTSTEESGFMGVYIGFYGAFSAKEKSTISATIIDLEKGEKLCNLDSEAQGTAGGVGFFYAVITDPLTESGAIEGLGKAIAKTIAQETLNNDVRIAVLAIEPHYDAQADNVIQAENVIGGTFTINTPNISTPTSAVIDFCEDFNTWSMKEITISNIGPKNGTMLDAKGTWRSGKQDGAIKQCVINIPEGEYLIKYIVEVTHQDLTQRISNHGLVNLRSQHVYQFSNNAADNLTNTQISTWMFEKETNRIVLGCKVRENNTCP